MNPLFGDSDHHLSGSSDHVQANAHTGGLFDQLDHTSLVGTPASDSRDWIHQTTPFTCDVVSQEMILHEFGFDVSEAQLTYEATSHGWLTDGGTSPENAAQLLDHYGVPTHTNYNGSLDAVTSEL